MDINNQYQYGPTGKNTWICPKCKAVNAEHFCYQCGTARPGAVSGRVCKCGYVNSPQARFCVQCGSSLDFPGNGGSRQQPQKRTAGKKGILLIAVLLVIAAGIVFMVKSHEHTWQSATCMSPMKCETCGKTQGTKADHEWKAATCYEPKTCIVCGETTGFVPGHNWKVATATEPKTCVRCGLTEGTPKGIPSYPFLDTTGDYIAVLTGQSEQVTLQSGSSILNIHALAFDKKIEKCEKMTVNLSVEMLAGTKCTDWQIWGRVNGSFEKIARMELPGGDGDTSQTVIFDRPVTFDAIAVTPTIPGGYSWKLGFSVTDVYLAD